MLLKVNQKRALKGYIESEIMNSKKLYIVLGTILVVYLILTIITDIIILSVRSQSNNSGGALLTGFGAVAICMLITAIIKASNKEIKTAFIFPINRKTYISGNFIMFGLNILGLLLLSSVIYIFETVIFKILATFYENLIYMNSVTLESFLSGFLISFCYIFALTVFTFFIFLLFTRFKQRGVILFFLIAGLPIIFKMGRAIYLNIFMFFYNEQAISLLIVKLVGLTMFFQILSYFCMRKMEVNN